jgi:hypothetical protein
MEAFEPDRNAIRSAVNRTCLLLGVRFGILTISQSGLGSNFY